MASITLDRISVAYPIYGTSARSLRGGVLRASVGGLIGVGSNDLVSVDALQDISLVLEDGDRLGVIGGNGAGKSTLLRVLARVCVPGRGQVHITGRVSPLFDAIAGMDLELNGQQNIFLRGIYLGMKPRQIREKVADIVAFTELGNFIHVPVRTYSTGMLIRLVFAIATAFEPEILLLDEGVGVGDAAFMEKAEQRLDRFITKAGILVLASHDENLIRKFCTKVLLLEHGRAVAVTGVDEALALYHERMASGFA